MKSANKNKTEVTLNLSLNVVDDFNDETDFPHKFLLNDTQVSKLSKAFANNFSANTNLWKTQLHKIGHSGGLLGRLLGPWLKTGLSLIRNIFRPLAKNVLTPLGLTAASAADAGIHKKMFRYGFTTFIISNGNEWYN